MTWVAVKDSRIFRCTDVILDAGVLWKPFTEFLMRDCMRQTLSVDYQRPGKCYFICTDSLADVDLEDPKIE